MILCEQCGNEFKYGKLIEKDFKKFVVCPYCGQHNMMKYNKKKKLNKKRGVRNEQR